MYEITYILTIIINSEIILIEYYLDNYEINKMKIIKQNFKKI